VKSHEDLDTTMRHMRQAADGNIDEFFEWMPNLGEDS
jgi:hypothetical protein